MNVKENFKNKLLGLIDIKQITYQELADYLCVDVRTIGYWIGKRLSIPCGPTLISIAKYFEIEPETLLL